MTLNDEVKTTYFFVKVRFCKFKRVEEGVGGSQTNMVAEISEAKLMLLKHSSCQTRLAIQNPFLPKGPEVDLITTDILVQ